MPHIILKRDDIVAGTLQILDLVPNESQRDLIYTTPGQTKYVNPAQNDPLTLVGAGPITVQGDTRGLTAWFATNVNDGSGVAAVGQFTVAVATPIVAGNTVTIGAFSFVATAAARTSGLNDFSISSGTDAGTATDLAAAINDAGNHSGALALLVTAVPAAAVVTIGADADGIAGNLVLATDNPGGFTPVGMAGGADADSLTAGEASVNADDVLGLLAFGDLTTAAVALTVAAINGALTTGAITAAQLSDVLDILAGFEYLVLGGTQVDLDGSTFLVSPAVGALGGPGFVAGTSRRVYDTSALLLSVNVGQLSLLLDSGYEFFGVGGAEGEAVVVYNDDGTLFV
jgi:hypothetical protein